MKTVALFGGSFDPPHLGHIAIVEALEKLDFLDKIIIVPTFLNPFKTKTFASEQQRYGWLVSLFEENDKVIVDDYELQQKRKVASIETVKYLLKKFEKVYLVIGADNLESLHKWEQFEILDSLVTFIVASREQITIADKFMRLDIDKNISSSELRKEMNKNKIPKKRANEIAQHYKENNAK